MTLRIMACALALSATVCAEDAALGNRLAAPVRLEAGGEPIDLSGSLGHAGPLVVDWDGDGSQDLLVGQYRDGRLRIYRNAGDGTPALGAHAWFEAGGKIGSVPTG